MLERNHFLVRLKSLLPTLLFVTFFYNISYLFQNTFFLNELKMEWCLILSKTLKVNVVVIVPLLLTLNIFYTLV